MPAPVVAGLCLYAVAAFAAPTGTILKACLLDLSFGASSSLNQAKENAPAFLHLDVVGMGLGRGFSRHWGAGLGTSLVSGDLISTLSFLPISGCVFYDLDPDARWRRRMAYATVEFVYNERDGWSGTKYPPYVTVAVGVSYTYYVVSPHLEAGYNSGREAFTCALGLSFPGGTYVLRPTRAGDRDR